MVCINERHFIGFNRLWIIFLSTSGLFGFHYSWRSMFNSELGTANVTSVPCAFICGYRSFPSAWTCCIYVDEGMANPLLRMLVLVWNKMELFHPVWMIFLSFAQWWAVLTLGLNGSFAKSVEEFDRSKQGSCSAPAYFHSGAIFLSTFHYLFPSFYLKIKRNSL